MKITHYGHACVLAEFTANGQPVRVLIDPGTYSAGFEGLRDLDAILITHEHPDHVDLDRLTPLLTANPKVKLIADPGTAGRLREADLEHEAVTPGDRLTVSGLTVNVLGGEHGIIHPLLPCIGNNGYLVGDRLFHPGDAFTVPPSPVEVLLLPTGAPWLKVSESIDYLRAVAPEVAVPIHQAGLANVHQQLHYQLFGALAPAGTKVQILDHGAEADF